ncbi:MAG: winged helix-turn-helix transcriptional regulator [Anaerolineae bacterium]|nr:winged helix-turn-helix transcriptional regulator [Anaerolineae bacterium]
MGQKTAVNETKLEEMSQVCKVLADSNRLRVFEALMRGISCNGWLTEELELSPNLLSHHLKVLREAGLVQDRRDVVDGRWIYYQVNLPALTELHQWLAHFFDPATVASQPHLCGPEATAARMGELTKPVIF